MLYQDEQGIHVERVACPAFLMSKQFGRAHLLEYFGYHFDRKFPMKKLITRAVNEITSHFLYVKNFLKTEKQLIINQF